MASVVPTYNFSWEQGEDGVISLVYKQGTPPVAVNLTGYQVRMDVRNTAGALLFIFNSADLTGEPLDTVGAADNEAVLGSDGSINIVVPRAASLGSGPLVGEIGNTLNYDIMLRDTSGKQKKILKGTITIGASQTRWI